MTTTVTTATPTTSRSTASVCAPPALASVDRVYEVTVDRDHFREMFRRSAEQGVEVPDVPEEEFEIGKPTVEITTRVDVSDYLDVKKRSMQAHASQISEASFFLAMPPEAFALAWGTEWFIRRNAPEGTAETSLLEGLV